MKRHARLSEEKEESTRKERKNDVLGFVRRTESTAPLAAPSFLFFWVLWRCFFLPPIKYPRQFPGATVEPQSKNTKSRLMDLLQRAQFLLQECNTIITSLEAWRACNSTLEVDGLQKMTSTLLAEQKFLEKVTRRTNWNRVGKGSLSME